VRRISFLLACALLAGGCHRQAAPPSPPRDPVEAARGLFDLARVESPSDAELERVLSPELVRSHRVPLLDALPVLAETRELKFETPEPLPGIDRAVVDLDATLAGGGRARGSVHVAPRGDGSWRVVWFQALGVAWPPLASPAGEGLSTSAPPVP
jgi:hypothetical protein